MNYLERIQKVTVVLDACEMGADRCVKASRELFKGKDLEVYALKLDKGMQYLSSESQAKIITCRSQMSQVLSRSEDLYISLCCNNRGALKAAEAKNRASKAGIRVGRHQSRRNPVDILIKSSEDSVLTRVFEYIGNILTSIQ